MAEFVLKIAGHTAHVTSLFASTPDFLGKYRSDEAPEFSITVFPEDLPAEQELWDIEAREEGFRPRKFSDQFLERAVIQRKFAEALFEKDILLFHGSTLAFGGKAYIFAGRSGTGKSTHTRLWRETFGNQVIMVNDDKPFLTITDSGILASGSPWSGKHGLDSSITLPLGGICILERGTENRIVPLSPEEALPMLAEHGCPPSEPEVRYIALVEKLSRSVPLWKMECTKDPAAARTARKTMCP